MLSEPEEDSLHVVNWDEYGPLSREEGPAWEDLVNRVIENEAQTSVVVPAVAVGAEQLLELGSRLVSQSDRRLQRGWV